MAQTVKCDLYRCGKQVEVKVTLLGTPGWYTVSFAKDPFVPEPALHMVDQRTRWDFCSRECLSSWARGE